MFNLIISVILLVAGSVITFFEKVYNNKHADKPKKISRYVWAAFILSFIGAISTLYNGYSTLQTAKTTANLNKTLNDSLQKKQERIEKLQTQQLGKAITIIEKQDLQQKKIDSLSKSNSNLSDQITSGYKNQNDYLTSADSYCYLEPETRHSTFINFRLKHKGKYAAKAVRITVEDLASRKIGSSDPRAVQNRIRETTKTYNYGDVYDDVFEPLFAMPIKDIMNEFDYSIKIYSNSGIIIERIWMDSVRGSLMEVKKSNKIVEQLSNF